MRLTSKGVLHPKNLLSYSFRIKQWGGWEPLCLSWVDATLPSSVPPLGWQGIYLCLHSQARSTSYCFVCVQRACPSSLSSLGRMWVLGCHYSVVRGMSLRGFVTKQACLVLWLSTLAFLSTHEHIGVSQAFSSYSPQVELTFNHLVSLCTPSCSESCFSNISWHSWFYHASFFSL